MIQGIVAAVPKNIERNDDEAFVKATGVQERRIVTGEQNTLTLATAAAKRILEELDWSPETLNALVVVTQTPIARMPATACALAVALGFKGAAFDINLACSGFIYGLSVAASFGYRRTLLIAGDCVSQMVNKEDRGTAMLFGDCVTATAIHEGRFVNARLGTDGAGFEHLIADPTIRMNGPEVLNFALARVPQLVADVTMSAYTDFVFFHQANGVMLKHIARKCKLAEDRVPMNIEKYGNTSSASIPLLMADSAATKQLKARKNRVAMFGFGAGWSWGGVLLDIEPMRVLELIEV